jgi:hypothetical protein
VFPIGNRTIEEAMRGACLLTSPSTRVHRCALRGPNNLLRYSPTRRLTNVQFNSNCDIYHSYHIITLIKMISQPRPPEGRITISQP